MINSNNEVCKNCDVMWCTKCGEKKEERARVCSREEKRREREREEVRAGKSKEGQEMANILTLN